MNAFILSVGDELVLGQTVDTNSAWISQQLAAIGFPVVAHATVGDDQTDIERVIRTAADSCDVLIVSGGIGPTEDDLTRQALAAVLGTPLTTNQAWVDHMRAHFASRGRPMPERNLVQALIPDGAAGIRNTAGTAMGVRARVGRCEVFAVPGVPKEMKAMLARDVLPYCHEHGGGAVILQETLHTFGLGESAIGERLGELMQRGRNPSVGTTVANGLVSLRVNCRATSAEQGRRDLDATVAACEAALPGLIFGRGADTLPGVVMRLLNDRPTTIATAESCTGGWIAKLLTDQPGSSRYFLQGWVTYTNASKTEQLGVREETLAAHGAVSEPVVMEMAEGARQRAGTDVALAVSGIAGPDGGTEAKPVGTICFALAHAGGTLTRTLGMFGDRDMVRDRSAKMMLTFLRCHLLGRQLPF